MPLIHIVISLALLEFLVFAFAVGKARERYNLPAPATTGNEMFERYYRVQSNTLEQLIIFLPSLVLFGRYFGSYIAAALGLVFIIGRAVYFFGYVKDPKARHPGFLLSFVPNVILLIGALIGAIRAQILVG